MESLSERNERKRYEEAKRKQKRNRIIAAIIVVILIAGVVVYAIDSQINRNYNGYQVEKKFDRKDSNTVKYIDYNGRILKYSRDGISELDDSGKVVWTSTYDMKNPSVAFCGNYVAVADIAGKEICVYNRTNSTDIKKINVVLPIVKIDIAEQGVVAVVLEDSDSNQINIYDPYNISEQLLVSIPTNVETDGFPVDISISDDGERLVTNFINISNGQAKTSINFYNFNEVGKNSVNRIVGVRDFKQTIVAKTTFLNNDTVCAYTENGFSLYSMKEIPKDIYEETFDKAIKSVFSNDQYIGIILENEKNVENHYNTDSNKEDTSDIEGVSGEEKENSKIGENSEKKETGTNLEEQDEIASKGGADNSDFVTSEAPSVEKEENKSQDNNHSEEKETDNEQKQKEKNNNINNKRYQLKIYNIKGKKVLDTSIDYNYDTVIMGKDEIIFQSNLECYIMRVNGTEKFHYTFDKNVQYFLKTTSKEHYYVVDEKEISKIRLIME